MKRELSGASILILASIACGSSSVLAQEADPNLPAEPTAEELLLLPDTAACDPAMLPEGQTCDAAAIVEGEPLPPDQMANEAPVLEQDPSIVEQPEMNVLVDQVPPDQPPEDIPMDAATAPDEQPMDLPLDQNLAEEQPMEAPAEQAILPAEQQLFDENAPADPNMAVDAIPPLDAPLDAPPIDQALDQPALLPEGELLAEPAVSTDLSLPEAPIDQALPLDGQLPEAPVDQAIDQPLFEAPATDQATIPEDQLLPPPTDGVAAVPEGQLLPEPVDQATGQPLLDLPVDQALPEDQLLPEPTTDQATIPEDQLLPPPTDGVATAPEDQLLPPPTDGMAAVPEDQLLPEPTVDQALPVAPDAGVDAAMLPAAGAASQVPAVDVLGNPVDMTGQVLVTIQNVSSADLMVFVEPEGGGEPVPVVTLPPGYQALQPSPVGRTWGLAQNDAWVGGFRPTAEPRQLLRFTGAVPQ